MFIYFLIVDDASGRYTTGFFYGNNYFTGSLSLCTTIHRNDIHEDTFRKLTHNCSLSEQIFFTEK